MLPGQLNLRLSCPGKIIILPGQDNNFFFSCPKYASVLIPAMTEINFKLKLFSNVKGINPRLFRPTSL